MTNIQKTMFELINKYEQMSFDELNNHIIETLRAPLCELLSAVNNEIIESTKLLNDINFNSINQLFDNTKIYQSKIKRFPTLQLNNFVAKQTNVASTVPAISECEILTRIALNPIVDNFKYKSNLYMACTYSNLSLYLDEEYPWAA